MSEIEERILRVDTALAKQLQRSIERNSRLVVENEKLRAALAPFAADKLPSQKRTDIDFNEWGLRCLMSKMEIARRDARKALAVSSDQRGSD